MIHSVKCLDKHFTAVISGDKKFEVRWNDRDYRVGDFIALNEVVEEEICDDSVDYVATGRSALFYISYILEDKEYCKPGFVVMSLIPCSIIMTDRITDLSVVRRPQDE